MGQVNRPCLEAGCGQFAAPKGRGRCPDHARLNDKSIDRAGRQIYKTKRWELTRRQVLFEEPLCRYCLAQGKEDLSEHVDHIDNDPFNNARENLQGLCASHHGSKTRREQLA